MALVVGAILFGLTAAACAAAAPHHKYVLKHPKRERCKAHYVKKVEKIKARRKGKVVRVRKTFCVYKNRYVLKHPKRERCKAHYVKKVEKIKARRKGKVVRVHKTFCVWVAPQKASTAPPPAPQPTPPAPQPTPPAPQPTTTTLTVKPRGCEFFSYEFGSTFVTSGRLEGDRPSTSRLR